MLERLERENIFLAPLDNDREWFRYHQLFAEFLQAELHRRYPDEVTILHRRATEWYLARDLPEQAFDHAVECGDLALVVQLFERYFASMVVGGQINVVRRWLNAIPQAWHDANPGIGVAQAYMLLYSGELEAGMRLLDEVEQRAHEQDPDMRRYLA
jgi:LuxR family maltose regulon positive regulatory protein